MHYRLSSSLKMLPCHQSSHEKRAVVLFEVAVMRMRSGRQIRLPLIRLTNVYVSKWAQAVRAKPFHRGPGHCSHYAVVTLQSPESSWPPVATVSLKILQIYSWPWVVERRFTLQVCFETNHIIASFIFASLCDSCTLNEVDSNDLLLKQEASFLGCRDWAVT